MVAIYVLLFFLVRLKNVFGTLYANVAKFSTVTDMTQSRYVFQTCLGAATLSNAFMPQQTSNPQFTLNMALDATASVGPCSKIGGYEIERKKKGKKRKGRNEMKSKEEKKW